MNDGKSITYLFHLPAYVYETFHTDTMCIGICKGLFVAMLPLRGKNPRTILWERVWKGILIHISKESRELDSAE